MSNYSLNLLTSLNELGLIITNVRSLANMDASNVKGSEETKRERNNAKKRQQSGAHGRGQDNRRLVKDERGNTRPTSQDLAKASYAGTSPFGVRQRSTGNKASTSGIKKRNKKIPNQSLQPLDTNPSTSIAHTEDVNEVDDVEDDMESFDIDCSPYNNVHEWNDDEESDDREQHDEGRPRGGLNSFQSGRSRRTVSPYPYRLKLKKQNGNKWAVDENYDPWDEGSFFDDGRAASPAPGFTELDHGNSGYKEENPHFSWHADDPMEDRLGDLNLHDRYTVLGGDHGNNLNLNPSCLKKKANFEDQRHVLNVSWDDDENNEFDTAAEHEIDDGGCGKVEDNGKSYPLVEERKDEIFPDASLEGQAKADPIPESVESRTSRMISTPANSIDKAVILEADVKTEGFAGEIQSPSIPDDVHVDIDANQCSETDRKTKGDPKCHSSKDSKPLQSLLEEWTDEAISHLTDDEKYRLMKKQEHLEIARYDDPHLCRADRIKLLWEDCARKERLLHKLRPNSTAKKSLAGKGSTLTTDVNSYNHYNY